MELLSFLYALRKHFQRKCSVHLALCVNTLGESAFFQLRLAGTLWVGVLSFRGALRGAFAWGCFLAFALCVNTLDGSALFPERFACTRWMGVLSSLYTSRTTLWMGVLSFLSALRKTFGWECSLSLALCVHTLDGSALFP